MILSTLSSSCIVAVPASRCTADFEEEETLILLEVVQNSEVMREFDIPHKNASLDKLERWRKFTLVLNATRRFRYCAKVKKRREMEEDNRKFKVGVIAVTAAHKFIEVLFAEARSQAQKHGFSVHVFELLNMMGSLAHYLRLGEVAGIAKSLKVDSVDEGIAGSDEDINGRYEVFGKNVYKEKPPKGFWIFVWEALHDFTLIILILCAVVSLAIGIPTGGILQGWYDGVGILSSVLIVVFVTAANDYRQSLQFRDLDQEKKKIQVQVTRAGRRQKINIYDVVVGDIVHLSAGDQVPADGVFISGYSLTINESALTGESEPTHASAEKPFLKSGTKVQDGLGKMLVTSVGMNTEWGQLMSTLSEGGIDETPLQAKLNGVATLVGKIGLGFAFVTFIVLLIRFFVSKEDLKHWSGDDFIEIMNFFAIAVTIVVVAVPEGLPLAVTLSLAYAMKQMMKEKALVRNLAACETMGSATCICSDKTGTLTTNQMTVVKAWIGGTVQESLKARLVRGEDALDSLLQGIFQNTGGEVVEYGGEPELIGSPTETAILRFGLELGGHFQGVRSKSEIVEVEPFNSIKKRMSVLLKLTEGNYRLHCKGASEIVLAMCENIMDANGQIIPLDDSKRNEITRVIQAFARDALRTLCFAFKDLEDSPCKCSWPEQGYTCAAIVGIKDPIRPGVKDAVSLCIKAKIKVRMVTGDDIETAKAIARECNILTEDGIAVEGPEFRTWTESQRGEKIPKIQVMARSSPTDKLLLVKNLKELYDDVVAVTGDGTNDAPALQEADIGLAMGISGTEVAKENADIVILDDNFSSIVNVVKWGRSVYTNIQKFVQFQLTANLVALVINFSSACITGQVPLTAVQLLWVNLIMDSLGALALATEPPYDELMNKEPVGRKGTFITNVMWRNIFGQAIYQLIILWVLQFKGKEVLHLNDENAQEVLDTLIFNSFVFCQVFNELNSRKMEELNIFKHFFNNKVFLTVILFTIIFQVVMVEFLGRLANTVPLSKELWLVSVLTGFCSLFVGYFVKLIPVPSKCISDYITFNSSNKNDELSENLIHHSMKVVNLLD